jgi:hypothetical protein
MSGRLCVSKVEYTTSARKRQTGVLIRQVGVSGKVEPMLQWLFFGLFLLIHLLPDEDANLGQPDQQRRADDG